MGYIFHRKWRYRITAVALMIVMAAITAAACIQEGVEPQFIAGSAAAAARARSAPLPPPAPPANRRRAAPPGRSRHISGVSSYFPPGGCFHSPLYMIFRRREIGRFAVLQSRMSGAEPGADPGGRKPFSWPKRAFLPPDPYSSEKAVLGERVFFTMYS